MPTPDFPGVRRYDRVEHEPDRIEVRLICPPAHPHFDHLGPVLFGYVNGFFKTYHLLVNEPPNRGVTGLHAASGRFTAKFLNRQLWCLCDLLQKPVQFARQPRMAIPAKRHGFNTSNLAEKPARRTAVATEIPNREAASRHFIPSSTETNIRRRKSSKNDRVHADLYSGQHDLLPDFGLVYK
jgi:hypothetical protein